MNSTPSSQAQPPMQEPTPEQKAALAAQDYAKWRALAATPGLSPRTAAWAADAARSAKAELRLRQKAAAFQEGQDANPTQDPNITRLLGLQPNDSTPSTAGSSTSPGTSV